MSGVNKALTIPFLILIFAYFLFCCPLNDDHRTTMFIHNGGFDKKSVMSGNKQYLSKVKIEHYLQFLYLIKMIYFINYM